MLVFARKENERVRVKVTIEGIEKEIIVTVTKVSNKKVKLGFEADPDVAIFREELLTGSDSKMEIFS